MPDESGARVSEAMFAMGGGADTRARTLCSPSSARAPSGAAQRGSFPSSYSHSGTVMTSPGLTGARSERTRRPPPGAAATAARDIRAARAASEVSAAPRSPSHARGANRGSDRTLPAPKARGMARRTAGATRTVLASMASRSRAQRAAGSSWRSARPSESAGCVSAGCPSARFSGPDATTAFATPSTGGSATRPRLEIASSVEAETVIRRRAVQAPSAFVGADQRLVLPAERRTALLAAVLHFKHGSPTF